MVVVEYIVVEVAAVVVIVVMYVVAVDVAIGDGSCNLSGNSEIFQTSWLCSPSIRSYVANTCSVTFRIDFK